MDKDSVDIIGWSKAQEVISVCSLIKVINLKAEKEALKVEKKVL